MKKILTIPNLISFVRILMVPLFAWLYLKNYLLAALVVLVLSALSDTLDGTIARRFNMISDMGKWLDPLADKLTQLTLAVLMFLRFHGSTNELMQKFAWVFLLFLGKELLMLLVALVLMLKKKRPSAAEIWGKAATVMFYVIMGLMFLVGPEVGALLQWWPRLELPMAPVPVVQILVMANLVLTFIAFFSYVPDTCRKLFKEGKEEKDEKEEKEE
ncbi:MAG: CDP-alcohol phosphatidyltransferase family protein [Oscillospiraceae bacterium]|nr:CDP-alcohol phosphatidyltransferase family protein [Oscillospiraceae bacterium]